MPKIITEKNLSLLIDELIVAGTRVVGPKLAGGMTIYEPLCKGVELDLAELPRRSAKETFFPVCEDILAYEKKDGKTSVTDVNLGKLPETVLIGSRPCDSAAPGILDAVFSWDYNDEFFLERRRKTTIIGLACTRADDACFCTAVGFSPSDRNGSDLFLSPLKDGGYAVEPITEKGEALLANHSGLFQDQSEILLTPPAEPAMEKLDLTKIKGWLDNNFESDFWKEIADRCVGCGACAFICPACHFNDLCYIYRF